MVFSLFLWFMNTASDCSSIRGWVCSVMSLGNNIMLRHSSGSYLLCCEVLQLRRPLFDNCHVNRHHVNRSLHCSTSLFPFAVIRNHRVVIIIFMHVSVYTRKWFSRGNGWKVVLWVFVLVVQEIDTKALCKFGKLNTWSTLHPEPHFNQNTSLSSHEHLKVLILLIQICFRPGPAKMKGYF